MMSNSAIRLGKENGKRRSNKKRREREEMKLK
jgi:hypothetical protein